MTDITPTKLEFEEPYRDNSGTEFAVRYDGTKVGDEIEIERITTLNFPINKLDWLIDRLKRVKELTNG